MLPARFSSFSQSSYGFSAPIFRGVNSHPRREVPSFPFDSKNAAMIHRSTWVGANPRPVFFTPIPSNSVEEDREHRTTENTYITCNRATPPGRNLHPSASVEDPKDEITVMPKIAWTATTTECGTEENSHTRCVSFSSHCVVDSAVSSYHHPTTDEIANKRSASEDLQSLSSLSSSEPSDGFHPYQKTTKKIRLCDVDDANLFDDGDDHEEEEHGNFVFPLPRAYDENTVSRQDPKAFRPTSMSGLDLLCSVVSDHIHISSEQNSSTKTCSCPRSRCIKLYCECFQSGNYCSALCSCKKCKNSEADSGLNGARTMAIRNLLSRNPNAIYLKTQRNTVSPEITDRPDIVCRCTKTNCLKLYCECFQHGKICDPNYCTCVKCLNTEAESGKDGKRTIARDSCLERNPNAFVVKVKEVGSGCACKFSRCLKKYCECFNTGLSCHQKCSCQNCANINPSELKNRLKAVQFSNPGNTGDISARQ